MNKSFKPYYKWNTFNTITGSTSAPGKRCKVLNLIINGIPSIQPDGSVVKKNVFKVLNLIINGIPSIRICGLKIRRI